MKQAISVGGGLVLLLLATVNAAAEERGPGPIAANLTAQFYDVDEDVVEVHVLQQTALTATVVASAPGGHSCTFQMMPAPAETAAPHGWLIAHTSCKT